MTFHNENRERPAVQNISAYFVWTKAIVSINIVVVIIFSNIIELAGSANRVLLYRCSEAKARDIGLSQSASNDYFIACSPASTICPRIGPLLIDRPVPTAGEK